MYQTCFSWPLQKLFIYPPLQGHHPHLRAFGLRESEKVFNCEGGSVQASRWWGQLMSRWQPEIALCVCTLRIHSPFKILNYNRFHWHFTMKFVNNLWKMRGRDGHMYMKEGGGGMLVSLCFLKYFGQRLLELR